MKDAKFWLSIAIGIAGFLIILGGVYRLTVLNDVTGTGGGMIAGGVVTMIFAAGVDKVLDYFFGR